MPASHGICILTSTRSWVRTSPEPAGPEGTAYGLEAKDPLEACLDTTGARCWSGTLHADSGKHAAAIGDHVAD